MALLDYKITNFSQSGRHVSANVRIFRGSMQNVTTTNIVTGESTTVNRYVRTAPVALRHFEADVPRDMTRAEFETKVRAFLNKKLLDYASANGHTVIGEEQDLNDYEALSNEVAT